MTNLLHHKVLGEGSPLVILHGLFGSLDNWMTLGKRFSEHFQVVLVDQRNHGRSFHSDTLSYAGMAEDLEVLIEHLNLESPILAGHSMGGKTAMQYAAFHPNRIAKLIVADIAPKFYPVHHHTIIEGLKSIPIAELTSRRQADKILESCIPELGTRSFLMKNIKRNAEGFAWKMNLNAISDNIEELSRTPDYHLPIEVPALFMRGGASSYISDKDFDGIKEIFPAARLVTLEGAGHWLHADDPDRFYDEVMAFVRA